MRNRLVLRVIVVVAGVIGLLLGVAIALLQTSTAKRLAFEQVPPEYGLICHLLGS